jgi:pimeloyl-ACP methyl ester carboxylesterase
MKTTLWGLALVGLLLIFLSVWQIKSAEQGLQIIELRNTQPPLTFFQAWEANPLERPSVLIGHGFAGSGVIMRGYALTLAQAGFNVVTWDFDGHGRNPAPLGSLTQTQDLILNVEQALDEVVQKGLVDPQQVAILGHSMGSGVALTYGQAHPATGATIAISPVLRQVTPQLPRNLLLMAGTSEANFLENAKVLLAQAGGEGTDYQQGTARDLVEIPGANHISILFDTKSHQAALGWLEAVYGPQPGGKAYTDRRMAWFALGVVGSLLLANVLGSLVKPASTERSSARPLWRRLIALISGILGATLVLALLSRVGIDLSALFGIRVGGYLLVWFILSGILALAVLGIWPTGLSWRAVLAGLLSFSVLWLGIGLLGDIVWQPWLLVMPRLVLWPLAALLLLPWFLAVSELGRGSGWLAQISSWLAHSAILLGGLFLAMRLTPGIGFLILLAPVFPIFFALHALACGTYRGGWPFAISGALFTSWMLLAVFPLG